MFLGSKAEATPLPGNRAQARRLLGLRAMRVLITGITGFAGSHLAEYILAEHPEVAVYGTYRWRSRMENLEQLSAHGVLDVIEGRYSAGAGQPDEARKGRVTLLHCELTDAGAVDRKSTRLNSSH